MQAERARHASSEREQKSTAQCAASQLGHLRPFCCCAARGTWVPRGAARCAMPTARVQPASPAAMSCGRRMTVSHAIRRVLRAVPRRRGTFDALSAPSATPAPNRRLSRCLRPSIAAARHTWLPRGAGMLCAPWPITRGAAATLHFHLTTHTPAYRGVMRSE